MRNAAMLTYYVESFLCIHNVVYLGVVHAKLKPA